MRPAWLLLSSWSYRLSFCGGGGGSLRPTAIGLRLGQSGLPENACFRRNRVGEDEARPTARVTAVKGVEASLARPAGVAEDTGDAGTDAATPALAPSLTVTGMLGGRQNERK